MFARAVLSRMGATATRSGMNTARQLGSSPIVERALPALRRHAAPLGSQMGPLALQLRHMCSKAAEVGSGGEVADEPAERIWIFGKTWSKEKGRFITERELMRLENSSRSQRRTWAKLAKRRARRKRRRARRAAGHYNF
mmetsp:Transcript_7607/g.23737  ORF Transcript_7607/g.23737 Transcript_7607/m.23737 type:complete len:139 (-) Transcript_7607:362-778(-)